MVKTVEKAFDFLFVDVAVGFDGDVAAGEACAAGGKDDVNLGVHAPVAELFGDGGAVVFQNGAGSKDVARAFEAADERVAGAVIFRCPGVGNGQDGDPDRVEVA